LDEKEGFNQRIEPRYFYGLILRGNDGDIIEIARSIKEIVNKYDSVKVVYAKTSLVKLWMVERDKPNDGIGRNDSRHQ